MVSQCVSDTDTPHQNHWSPWLHDTLSEIDGKVKAIRSLLEVRDESCSLTRSEVDPSKKQEILKILEELKRSYSSLAESHDRLTSQTESGIRGDPGMVDSSDPESAVEDPESSNSDLEKKSWKIIRYSDWEKTEAQCKFEVVRLIEENLREQAELVRRNEEKRGIIRRLRSEMEGLRAEIRTQQECLACRKINLRRIGSNSNNSSLFKVSRFGGLVIGKIFRRSFSQTSS